MAGRARAVGWRGDLADAVLALVAGGVQFLLLALQTDPAAAGWRPHDALATALVLAQALPLAVRRRAPLAVLAVVLAANTAYYVLGYAPSGLDLGVVVALATVAARCELRVSLPVGVAVVGSFLVLWALGIGPWWGRATWPLVSYLVVFVGAGWVVGRHERVRRRARDARSAELVARVRRAEEERADDLERAVAEERLRIARELHDTVAHELSLMVVQAGAGRRVLDTDPERTRDALAVVEEAGRRGLSAMPSLVRALRTGDVDDPRRPQPGPADLPALVERLRTAGLPTALEVEGEPGELPAGVGLSAYRVVQESLTNALRHAGPARATVVVRWCPDALHVTVTDDGRGPRTGWRDGGGHGLVGAAERVRLLGGRLEAGAGPDGGFRVSARFPRSATG